MKKFTNTHISAVRPSSERQQLADPATTGLFLYFPARTQSQPKLRAFIDTALALAAGKPSQP